MVPYFNHRHNQFQQDLALIAYLLLLTLAVVFTLAHVAQMLPGSCCVLLLRTLNLLVDPQGVGRSDQDRALQTLQETGVMLSEPV